MTSNTWQLCEKTFSLKTARAWEGLFTLGDQGLEMFSDIGFAYLWKP